MKRRIIYIICVLSVIIPIITDAQSGKTTGSKGMSSLASLDLQAPVGVFARSHFAGAGINYSWSHHRYGWFALPKKWIGLTVSAGADYYFGKKIKPAGYDFRFGNYLYGYVLGGIMANPGPMTSISLMAGPSMGIYKENSEMGVAAALSGLYYLEKNIAIGPGISYKKTKKTDPLWSAMIRLSYAF